MTVKVKDFINVLKKYFDQEVRKIIREELFAVLNLKKQDDHTNLMRGLGLYSTIQSNISENSSNERPGVILEEKEEDNSIPSFLQKALTRNYSDVINHPKFKNRNAENRENQPIG